MAKRELLITTKEFSEKQEHEYLEKLLAKDSHGNPKMWNPEYARQVKAEGESLFGTQPYSEEVVLIDNWNDSERKEFLTKTAIEAEKQMARKDADRYLRELKG